MIYIDKKTIDQYEVKMKIKFAYGAAPGSPNNVKETETQDKIKIVDETGVFVFSLADPAAKAAEAAMPLLAERFDELFASEERFVKEEVLGKITEGSLLFVAVKDNRYLAGHKGGGLIARLNGSCSVFSKPEAEDDNAASLRIYKGDLPESFGFMLMSEGACQSIYEYSTGNLSPACGTFFEWLKEHDEETVSEALTDNINKYFLKNVKGDISVAVMVSEEEEIAPAEVVPATEVIETREPDKIPEIEEADKYTEESMPVKEKGSNAKILRYIIAVLVVLAAIYVCTLIRPDGAEQKDRVDAETKPPVTKSAENYEPTDESYEPTVTFSVKTPVSFDAGEYKVGMDIPAGEYFFWTGEMLRPDSIVVNDDSCLSAELYCMTIQLNEWDTLVSEHRFTAAENVNPVEATNGTLISGKYKIGKDIAPGKYTVTRINKNEEGRYYSIFDEEISNDTEISDDTTVVVPEEGYAVFYNSVVVVE